MQRSQRSVDNHALEYAIEQANLRNVGLRVVFGLTDDYPDANSRHYRFLLEGLLDVKNGLSRRGIAFHVLHAHPADAALAAADAASLLVCDAAYLEHLRAWRRRVAERAACPVVQVECDLIVPVATASNKREYAARTIRPKIMRQLESHLELPAPQQLNRPVTAPQRRFPMAAVSVDDTDDALSRLTIDRSLPTVEAFFRGGESAALALFQRFVERSLPSYSSSRNQPQSDHSSYMSMYLHFGHISPIRLIREVRALPNAVDNGEQIERFIEALAVRRELAFNYCYFEPNYASYEALPNWALQTLEEHQSDRRPALYNREELENAQTHDRYWNAAMREMRAAGYLHNYMRMYWGKKILEWSERPKGAFETTLALTNKYFLDGRDPASFANVGWVFGLHDRPWSERMIYGKVRVMTAGGLERKCDINGYVSKVNQLLQRVNETHA